MTTDSTGKIVVESTRLAQLVPEAVAQAIASHIHATAIGDLPSKSDLAEALSEVQLQTQMTGTSLLRVTLADPAWALQRAGWLGVTVDGLLDEIELEFPVSTGRFWRIAMVEGSTDLSQPNVTLTFQDRPVAMLLDRRGALTIAPGSTTRAQFIGQLVADCNSTYSAYPQLQYISPDVSTADIVTMSKTTTTTTSASGTSKQSTTTHLSDGALNPKGTNWHSIINKFPGYAGQNPLLLTQQQQFVEEFCLQTGLDVGVVSAWTLSEYYGVPVSHYHPQSPNNWLSVGLTDSGPTGISYGTLWLTPKGGADLSAAVLKGKAGTPSDSILAIIKTAGQSPSVQLKAIYTSNWASSHYTQGGDPWGTNIIRNYKTVTGIDVSNAITLPPTPPTVASLAAATGQLRRGDTSNPDESSWECMQRLANEVQWFCFVIGQRLYYMDGPQLAAQKPILTLELDESGTRWTATDTVTGQTAEDLVVSLQYTFDNTAFIYQATHKRKGHTVRRTSVRVPQTPSSVKMNMICGVLDYSAGDVVQFKNAGPINGKWIVEDTTRNCLLDMHTQFTLAPPILPVLEQGVSFVGATTTGTPSPLRGKAWFASLIGDGAKYVGPDQGIDFTGAANIFALTDGVVTRCDPTGVHFIQGDGAMIVYKMTSAPPGATPGTPATASDYVYVMESLTPVAGLAVGSKIKRGDWIAQATGTGQVPGIECGFAQGPDGGAFGTVMDGKTGGPPPIWGLLFGHFVAYCTSVLKTLPGGKHAQSNLPTSVVLGGTTTEATATPATSQPLPPGTFGSGSQRPSYSVPSVWGRQFQI